MKSIERKTIIQIVWGFALVVAGMGVFYKIPQKIAEIEKTGFFSTSIFFVRFSLYLISILLIGGGIKKIITGCRTSDK